MVKGIFPDLKTYERMASALEKMAGSGTGNIDDYTNAPGGKTILRGDREFGYYGIVKPEDFGLIEGNPASQQDFNGANLAIAIGLTQGSAQNTNVPWFKFSVNGDIVFVPIKTIRYSTSWNAIYNAGAVYGDGSIGVNPPGGRAGHKLSVDGSTSSFVADANYNFLQDGAVIANVGDTIVTRGFANAANNGEFVVTAITETTIKVSGTLVTEPSGRNGTSIYKKGTEVAQNAEVTTGDNRYRVQLLKGASQDPLNSFSDSDRDMIGGHNEWENLILPLHEHAKIGNWIYPQYVGAVEYWGLDLTDKDLRTHYTHGYGSYTWTQETSDDGGFRRVVRGGDGASDGGRDASWNAVSIRGWRPALRLLS